VNVVPPTWYAHDICPCCGQGQLAFARCAACGRIALMCGELDTVFPDPRDLSLRADACACGANLLEAATSAQLDAAGFGPEARH
jgi:hypothetical protein